ncbi:ESX secretion-associated protein EspG [Gordonia rhizosphera]|uniref:ESX secretion-associated protein EspG n=1 Tax=Gordonia rhizosphera NBRC 16068 TaxID=1108045 RepID=K6WRG2_9ACTN|nr:ESX secretion-associated protein EspG [Gordonia rhizosphera]GAB89144.1 hypothetical protein GORHZ_052_00120 [Gordonia rhizosphera NBRC 16068]
MTSDNDLRPVGRVDSLTVRVFCQAYGLDTMPYPFIAQIDARDGDELARQEAVILEALQTNPPVHLTRWIQTSMHPDISAQLYGVFVNDDAVTSSIRINAVRQRDDGFVAVQKSGPTQATDIVIYQTDATHLGTAMLGFTPERAAGGLGEVQLEAPTDTQKTRTGSILSRNDQDSDGAASAFRHAATEFSAFVQVTPFRLTDWGYDEKCYHVHWEHKAGDGQYLILQGDGTSAVPADRARLRREVDRCIAKSVQVVREQRDSFADG